MKLGLSVQPDSIRKMLQAMANRLTPQDNLQCKVLGPIVTPGGANTEFTVTHNLGRVPTNYIWNVDQNAVIYDSRRANWSQSQMFLKSTAASVTLYLIVF